MLKKAAAESIKSKEVQDGGYNAEVYNDVCTVLGVKQYGSMPHCVLCLSVLQYIAILQYLIGFW